MTVEERLARLETRADGTDKWLQSIDGKVDELRDVANMGRGVWIFMLKAGGIVIALGGFATWAIDKFLHR